MYLLDTNYQGTLMQTFTANEAQARFDQLLDHVQNEPVQVTQHSRVVGVMVSAEDYQQMRLFYANRLRSTLQQSAQEAADMGLTDQSLEQLLTNDD